MGKVCVSCGGGIAAPKLKDDEAEKCENCGPGESEAPKSEEENKPQEESK